MRTMKELMDLVQKLIKYQSLTEEEKSMVCSEYELNAIDLEQLSESVSMIILASNKELNDAEIMLRLGKKLDNARIKRGYFTMSRDSFDLNDEELVEVKDQIKKSESEIKIYERFFGEEVPSQENAQIKK